MARHVHEDHGIIRKRGIELLLGGSPLLGEQVGVVPKPHHEFPGAEVPPRLDLFQLRDHLGHGLARPGRRRRTERLRLHVDERAEVAVAVDEAGHERLAGQIGDLRRRALVPQHLGLGADRHDPAAGDRHRLGRGLRGVHRHDRPAADDPLGRSSSGKRPEGRARGSCRTRQGNPSNRLDHGGDLRESGVNADA